MVRVFLPSQLHSYCGLQTRPEVVGATIGEALNELDRLFPGLKFRVIDEQDRVRPHMRLFVGGDAARDLTTPLRDGDELLIFGALSGG